VAHEQATKYAQKAPAHLWKMRQKSPRIIPPPVQTHRSSADLDASIMDNLNGSNSHQGIALHQKLQTTVRIR
jgi:hypothetical protein